MHGYSKLSTFSFSCHFKEDPVNYLQNFPYCDIRNRPLDSWIFHCFKQIFVVHQAQRQRSDECFYYNLNFSTSCQVMFWYAEKFEYSIRISTLVIHERKILLSEKWIHIRKDLNLFKKRQFDWRLFKGFGTSCKEGEINSF